MHYPHGSLAVDFVLEQAPALVFVSLDLKDVDGVTLVKRLSTEPGCPPVICVCEEARPSRIVAAVRAGAQDVVAYPFVADEVEAACLRAVVTTMPPVHEQDAAPTAASLDELVGASPAMDRVRALIRRVARSDAAVLITGESGVGKELVARAVHRLSRRGSGPFVARNCGAIPEVLFESEMFGTERGAYTDAVRRPGAFELADGGTLFLDEIGELPLSAQVKLLRAIEGSYNRVGGRDELSSDVRLVAATNRNLSAAVREGGFRGDLYYRVNVLQISIPPLRARREDIPLLVRHFAGVLGGLEGAQAFGSDALATLSGHEWQGNVRELRNVVERAMVCAEGVSVRSGDIQFG